jgi:hypothetical protein
VADCARHGIQVMCWTNNDQAFSSPLNTERDSKGWYVLLEDTRQKYGGAYAAVMSTLDFSSPGAWRYFVDSHVKIHRTTGLHFFFDSFYNLGFMPVSYRDCAPRTMWRGCVRACRALQKAGIDLLMESFGPWAQPQHGHPSSYNFGTIFACYRVGVGDDYTTVPSARALRDVNPKSAAGVYYALAHMAYTNIPLFEKKRRVDRVWTAAHKQALADYHAALPHMQRRYLQEDGLGVLWRDATGQSTTLWNFKDRRLELPGSVFELTTGRKLPKAARYNLNALHAYLITCG